MLAEYPLNLKLTDTVYERYANIQIPRPKIYTLATYGKIFLHT